MAHPWFFQTPGVGFRHAQLTETNRMSNLARRAVSGIARVLGESSSQSIAQDYRVLCLCLSTMLANDDDRCSLSASYVETMTGTSHGKAVAAIDRLLRSGAVEDITGTAAGESLRSRTSLWRNTRIVRLCATDGTQTPGAIDGTQTDGGPSAGESATEATQTESATEGTQSSITTSSLVELVIDSCICRERLSQHMDTVDPGSRTWNRDALGPRSMLVYSMVSNASPEPLSTRKVQDALRVRKSRALSALEPLSSAGLISSTPGGWTLGRVRPCDLSPVPSPSEAVETAHRPTESHLEPSMTECPDCQSYAEHGLPCPCDSTPDSHAALTPAVTRREPEVWRDGRGDVVYDVHRNPIRSEPDDGATVYVRSLDGTRFGERVMREGRAEFVTGRPAWSAA